MEKPSEFGSPGGIEVPQIGNKLASGTTITPTHRMHHVTGTAEIENIALTNLWPDFMGPLILITDGAWTWNANGNIASLSDGTVVNRAYPFWYDRSTAKWYPIGAITVNPS